MLKRVLDVAVSLAGLTLALPGMALIAALIWLDTGGPVLYGSRRVGRQGRLFTMYKFRSMVVGAHRQGPLVTAGDDPRITRVGRWLRRTKLDELPTLYNVLVGEMSLVGPRPENPLAATRYTRTQRRVWQVCPGITSPATVKYRHEERLLAGAHDLDALYFEIMQDKLRLDLEYIEQVSVWRDLGILWHTMQALFDRPPTDSPHVHA